MYAGLVIVFAVFMSALCVERDRHGAGGRRAHPAGCSTRCPAIRFRAPPCRSTSCAGRRRRPPTAPSPSTTSRRARITCRSTPGLLVAPHRGRRSTATAAPAMDVTVDPELHFEEVDVGHRRRAQPVRGVPADLRARGAGAAQAARDVARRHAREPAGRRVAQLRSGAGAAGDSRPRRRPRADSAGRPAHGRPVQPVGRPRRRRSIRRRRSGSRSCAARRRCSTARTRSAAWST